MKGIILLHGQQECNSNLNYIVCEIKNIINVVEFDEDQSIMIILAKFKEVEGILQVLTLTSDLPNINVGKYISLYGGNDEEIFYRFDAIKDNHRSITYYYNSNCMILMNNYVDKVEDSSIIGFSEKGLSFKVKFKDSDEYKTFTFLEKSNIKSIPIDSYIIYKINTKEIIKVIADGDFIAPFKPESFSPSHVASLRYNNDIYAPDTGQWAAEENDGELTTRLEEVHHVPFTLEGVYDMYIEDDMLEEE